MLTILLIVLVILAFGGFGHTGYRRGWYGGYNQGVAPSGGWLGGGLGLVLLIVVLVLLFGGFGAHNAVTPPPG